MTNRILDVAFGTVAASPEDFDTTSGRAALTMRAADDGTHDAFSAYDQALVEMVLSNAESYGPGATNYREMICGAGDPFAYFFNTLQSLSEGDAPGLES